MHNVRWYLRGDEVIERLRMFIAKLRKDEVRHALRFFPLLSEIWQSPQVCPIRFPPLGVWRILRIC